MFIPPFDINFKNNIMVYYSPIRRGITTNTTTTSSTSRDLSNAQQQTEREDWNPYSRYDKLFKGTPYESLYNSILQKYRFSPPGTVLGFFDGSNIKNAHNHIQAMYTELNQLVEKMYNEQYDKAQVEDARNYESPLNQSNLMKQAGLNPDLLGVGNSGVSPSSASNLGAAPSPDISFPNPLKFLGDFIGAASNAAAFTLQSVQAGQSLMNGRLDMMDKIDARVINDLALFSPDMQPGDDITPAFKLEYKTGNKRLDKRLNSRLSVFRDSLPVRAAKYRYRNEVDSARVDWHDTRSTPGFSDDDELFINEVAARLADMQLEFLEMTKQAGSMDASTRKGRQEYINNIINSETWFLKWVKNRAEKGSGLANRYLMWLTNPNNDGASGVINDAVNIYNAVKKPRKALKK